MMQAIKEYMHIENSKLDGLATLFMSQLPAYITGKLGLLAVS